MDDHPTQRQLEGLLSGRLPEPEAGEVFAHLELDCELCHRRLAPLLSAFLGPPPAGAVDPPALDAAVARAVAATLARHQDLERERARTRAKLPALRAARSLADLERSGIDRRDGWACCEALLECCRAERYRDPRRMVFFARCARIRSRFLDPQTYGRWAVADLQALAWAELGNAYRVADELPSAERAMRAAFRALERGSGDPLLLGRLLDLGASLDRSARRIAEASEKLDRAYSLFAVHSEWQSAGRALIQKSLCLLHEQRPEEALEVLESGLGLIDPAADPKLALAGAHNLVRLLVEKGEYRRAQSEIFRRRPLYLQAGDPLHLLKLGWLEAQIDVGLGRLERAEAGLERVRAALAAAGLKYKAALAGLELAAVWVRRGKPELVPPLADEILAVFRSLGIAREAIAAVLVLRRACEGGILNRQLVEHVGRFLEELERDPAARFEP